MLRKIVLIFSYFIFSCSSLTKNNRAQNPDDALRPYLGVEFFTDKKSTGELQLKFVFPDSPAFNAGLRSNDVILAINQKKIAEFGFKSGLDFIEYLSVQDLGSILNFTVVRNQNETLQFSILLSGRKYSYGQNYDQLPIFRLETDTKTLDFDFQKLIQNQKAEQDVNDLQKRFKLMTQQGDLLRHPAIISLQKNPFDVIRYSYWAKNELDQKKTSGLVSTSDFLLKYSGSKQLLKKIGPTPTPLEALGLFQKAKNEMLQAYHTLLPLEKEFLIKNLPGLAKKFSESVYIHEEADSAVLERNLKVIELAKKIKPIHLVNAQAQLSQLLSTQVLSELKFQAQSYLQRSGKSSTKISTGFGTIIISGTNDDVHRYAKTENIFVIIDLGGDDRYLDAPASIIDFSGQDSYETSAAWTTAASIMDLQFIIDVGGDDRYVGLEGSYAATLFGISFLWDLEGNDVYRCIKYCFGAGFGGVAVMIDEKGNDRFESLLLSQGLGIAGGYGVLADLNGDDDYYSKGLLRSDYDDAGQFQGWSQGIGVGLRGLASGGLGLIYDRQGKDSFDSGDFSQGGGYYFGWGLFINSGTEDDNYYGSHYSQGFTAHYAIGTFLEEGGNDNYFSKHDVGQGMSWDLGITLFEDFAGNDNYKTCEYCLGAASHSGFTFFIDDDGVDSYKGTLLPLETPVSNTYHSGVSLGFFIDRGNKADRYEKFKNNSQFLREKYQFFIDE